MASVYDSAARAIDELTKARASVVKNNARQIRNTDQRDFLRSLAYAWFNSHRPVIQQHLGSAAPLAGVDSAYRVVLDATEKSSARGTYLSALKTAKDRLIGLRAEIVVAVTLPATDEQPPDFSPLAADQTMKDILVRRWQECRKCLHGGAHLAATVMMGGLLEALLVARANTLRDKGPLFKCKATPIDEKTKKPLDLREWTLRPYIDVAFELGWISRSGKDIAAVLRDYRNYVHPEKERSHGIVLTDHDSTIFWEVTKSLVRQLLS